MKQIIIAIAALLFASAALNAQAPTPVQYKKGNLYQNGVKLTSSQALQVLGQDIYNKNYKPAKAMKITGISLVAAGGAATVLGGVLFGEALASKSPGETFVAMPATIVLLTGVGVTAIGGVLWGVGNKKLKNISLATNATGLAFNF